MSSASSGWSAPRCDSRTGAAHRRRGVPCQDASGHWSIVDAGQQAVQLLVVSDGHGSKRYDRSEVGSRLACSVALEVAEEQLRRSRTGHLNSEVDWPQWLAETLPRQICERWTAAVLAHAQAHPRTDGASPSTVPYGATLALLVLTPEWWGCTGLGDWDLVRVEGGGEATLLSEEPSDPNGGEATFSLCMKEAARYFSARSIWQPIDRSSTPFWLLLSTDGIRKSCAGDSDYLTLARYLAELPAAPAGQPSTELSEALDHISGQGSGDDVSVAIAQWGPLDPGKPRRSRRRSKPWTIVQPPAGGSDATTATSTPPAAQDRRTAQLPRGQRRRPARSAGTGSAKAGFWSPAVRASLAGASLLAAGVGAAAVLRWGPFAQPQGREDPAAISRRAVLQSEADRLCALPGGAAAEGVGATGAAGEDPRVSLGRSRAEPGPWQRASGGRTGATANQPSPARSFSPGGHGATPAAGESSPPNAGLSTVQSAQPAKGTVTGTASLAKARASQPDHLGSAAHDASPLRLDPIRVRAIRGTLINRQSTFASLLHRPAGANGFLMHPHGDPTGALIAWSSLQPTLNRAAASPRQTSTSGSVAGLGPGLLPARPEARTAVRLCPELLESLQLQWQRAQTQSSRTAAGHSDSPAIPINPRPAEPRLQPGPAPTGQDR